ncbi:3-hydroxyacyl-CoA dehydrogenase NAD-binding domain-containing protein [Salipiger abyssi]|uniref:3-hydroxyacyl-CoA dehydrogenase NAD-binding domain-containing protein n=1 Tax=Salipiger abyssi TaxID=1250539 RepID=UPI001A8C34C5|nr:3-hydroxyacyl-CoA dehydrogenase NAD-binding domain-containing protein [Salipiger abyssi]MBN9887162.1 enoyl-CoA hydratase/isomerase family protein [Salipiger abyssi]
MSEPVFLTVDQGVAVLTIDNPPVNALSRAVIDGLIAQLEVFAANDALAGLVINGRGRTFVAGGEIADFERPDFSSQKLNAFLIRLEAQERPVVAALHGTTLGGGVELALACHHRIAAQGTKFGLPEIKLGLIPGSHGTQRLPRLVGLSAATDMIMTGKTIGTDEALTLGLIDGIVDADRLTAAAIAQVHALAGKAPRRCSALPLPEAAPDALAALEARAGQPGQPAYDAALTAMTAARDLPFAEGIEVEMRAFEALVPTQASRAQRYLFFAERAATRIPGLDKQTAPRGIATVGVLGIGTMGAGIALAAAMAGYPVTLVEADGEALDRGMQKVQDTLDALVRRGRLDETAARACRERMTAAVGLDALGAVDLVIEAVFEDMDLKCGIAGSLGKVCKPRAIIATNTSTLDVDAIAAASGRAGDVIGTHFFSPAHIMKLLEIVRGAETAPEVLRGVMDFARRIGKTVVVSGVCYGFIGNRMAEVYMRESEAMQLEGATPGEIDGVAENPDVWGMAMGPSRMLDMAGIDVGARTVIEWIKSGAGPRDPSYRILCREMFASGLHGQKTGQGYYRYEGRKALPNPDAHELAEHLAAQFGIEREQAPNAAEIFERLLFPMVNEAARILEEGIAYRGSDIDVVWANGYGFPRWRGGPLFMADEIGLRTVVDRLDHYAETFGNPRGYWDVSPLLRHLADIGGRLSEWTDQSKQQRAQG